MTTNLAPGVSDSHPIFFPEEEPADIAYCENAECGYQVDAYEVRYDEDPCCPDCACPLQPENPREDR